VLSTASQRPCIYQLCGPPFLPTTAAPRTRPTLFPCGTRESDVTMDLLAGLNCTLQSCDFCAALREQLRALQPRDASPTAATVRDVALGLVFRHF